MSRKEYEFQIKSYMSGKPRRVYEDYLVGEAHYEHADGELERIKDKLYHTQKVLSRLLVELLDRRVINLDELGDILGETIYLAASDEESAS